MKKKRKLSPLARTLVILLVFICVITSLRLAFYVWQHGIDQPAVEDGLFDLTDFDFPYDQTMTLDGDWFFFPDQLLEPDDIDSQLNNAPLLHVPGNWNQAFPKQASPLDATGVGTYYMKILLPPNIHEQTNSLFSIYLQSMVHEGDVFINGESIDTIQTINIPDDNDIRLKPMTIDFMTDDYTIDIVIHAVNKQFTPYGGIQKSVRFGSKHAIDRYATTYNMLQLITVIILLVHFWYAWIFFRMSQQRIEIILYTSLLAMGICSVLLSDSYLILSIVPLSFEWLLRLSVSTYIMLGILSLLFFRVIYPKTFNHLGFWSLLVTNSLLFIVALTFPFQMAAFTAYGSFLFSTLTMIYIGVMIVRMAIGGVTDTPILTLSIVSLISSAIWGVIFNIMPMNLTYYPFDMIFALMVLAFFMMKRSNRMSKEANALSSKLQQANELKDFFIVSTTHELRNPLQSVINIIHHVLTKSTLDAKTERQMHLVLSATNHMNITLNDFYDISLIQDGNLSLQKRSISLQAITSAIIDMLQYSIDSDKITLRMDIPDDFPNIYADENRLTQIMFNLIHNATKFTEAGEIRICADNHGDFATIRIRDTGIGISEKVQENIFHPYVHGHESAARSGIGVGLAISKQLVELHGGSIQVSSKEGEGTEFSFTILLSNEKTAHLVRMDEPPKVAPDYTNESTNMLQSLQTEKQLSAFVAHSNILIVDDDSLNIEVITTILANDYQLTTAKSGEEALNLIKEKKFDLVIADVMMPNMSGYELTKKIREMYTISELPVLIFTARNLTEDMYTGFSVGANDYLTKPVNSVELHARVQSLLLLKYSIDERLHIEAAWLQAQIKPHFLFNTIHSIISLSYIDHDRMVHLLEMFSVYLRKSFQPLSDDHLISIEDELDLVKAYMEIQKERFHNRLKVHWDLDYDKSFYIPPYSLQTIVENSLSHGILKRVEGGNIWIRIHGNEREFVIQVKDDGVGMTASKLKKILTFSYGKEEGIGLVNTNARLQKVFGTSLKIKSEEDDGTIVSFTIPR